MDINLFNNDDNESYTAVASEISNDFHVQVKSLMLRYVRQGYSVRQIAHIMHGAVSDCESETLLTPPSKR